MLGEKMIVSEETNEILYVKNMCVGYMVQSITVFLVSITIYFVLKRWKYNHIFFSKQSRFPSKIPFDLISEVLYGKVVFNIGLIYCLQFVTTGIRPMKVDFVCSGEMKNQHLMVYCNL